ncbi:hypothetical protein M413DRAFT_318151 [Hebeloma cylindrosporum]|uniref:Uncharacterized protein n=1 Tax=Hebeloma cylindrosporum TaxID=76867 RepID=A0A0C3CR40_HEBCY|nr:hypothetical protein M413DRAFT_318151 [Hebeloma cylindrosporum h7]
MTFSSSMFGSISTTNVCPRSVMNVSSIAVVEAVPLMKGGKRQCCGSSRLMGRLSIHRVSTDKGSSSADGS